jgi:class 3 adenylate cyclase
MPLHSSKAILKNGNTSICPYCPTGLPQNLDDDWSDAAAIRPAAVTVTNLVADVRGFSAFSQKLGSESAYVMMKEIIASFADIVVSMQGTVKDYMLRLQVETNPVGYFKPHTAVSLHFHDIYQHLSGSFPVNVEMTGPSEEYFQSPEHIAIIDKLARFAETLPGVDKAIAYFGYLKFAGLSGTASHHREVRPVRVFPGYSMECDRIRHRHFRRPDPVPQRRSACFFPRTGR